MSTGSPCQEVVAEFRVVAEQISTRDLVQEYLAYKVFPTLSEWNMPKLKGTKEKNELVRLPYRFKFEKQFKGPCQEWLEMIETMCNEILGNYTKKEDQLMTAAFSTRPKRRLNRVMDALNFEYPDYEQLNKGAEGQKRKRIVSVLSKQAARMVKEDEEILKKKKILPWAEGGCSKEEEGCGSEAKDNWNRGRDSSNTFCCWHRRNSKGNDWILTYQAKSTGAASDEAFTEEEGASGSQEVCWAKRRRIITVIEAIEETPPPASASKITPAAEVATATEAASVEATTAEAATAEDTNLESTFSDIDKILLNMAAEEAVAAALETLAIVPRKGKEIAEDTSEGKDFNF
jgi:hypothetical protein